MSSSKLCGIMNITDSNDSYNKHPEYPEDNLYNDPDKSCKAWDTDVYNLECAGVSKMYGTICQYFRPIELFWIPHNIPGISTRRIAKY